VLFAGKLVPFERPLDVIAAATICRAQGRAVEVMVAGSGELNADMRARRPLRRSSEMPPAYAAADALVLPSDGRERSETGRLPMSNFGTAFGFSAPSRICGRSTRLAHLS
jgi:glycosyltransferase involved in cell wall biosynthesis